MQSLPVVILRKIICNSVEGEFASTDTVCNAAYCGAEKSFSRVVYITLSVSIADDDIIDIAVSVRCKKTDDTSPEIRYLHREVPVA